MKKGDKIKIIATGNNHLFKRGEIYDGVYDDDNRINIIVHGIGHHIREDDLGRVGHVVDYLWRYRSLVIKDVLGC